MYLYDLEKEGGCNTETDVGKGESKGSNTLVEIVLCLFLK